MFPWIRDLLVIFSHCPVITAIHSIFFHIARQCVVERDFLRNFFCNYLVMLQLLFKTLIRFILVKPDLVSSLYVTSCFAFPDVLMQKRRYSVLLQALVIAVCYLILLSALVIWEVNCHDVAYFRMYHLKVLPKLVDVIEQHTSMDLPGEYALEDAIFDFRLRDFECQEDECIKVVVIADLISQALVQV